MKIQILPFTCIKKHFDGELFEPVEVAGEFELQSLNYVLCGSNGSAYRFKSFENANYWIESNLIRASKHKFTQQMHIDALISKNSISYKDYLQLEIDTLEARNAGDWLGQRDEILDGGNAVN